MRASLAAAFLITATVAHAQPPAAPSHAPADADASNPKTEAMEALLSERESDEAFTKVIEEARKHGIKEQAILEARFLYHVDRNEDDAIAALLPEFLKLKDQFKVADSQIFSVQEDWLAVIEYVEAIAALKKGDKVSFKEHIKEAFWLSPRQGAAFATHIDRMRMEDAMGSIKMDFSTRLEPLQGSEAIVPSNLLKDKKALVLHFWNSWSEECTDSMPDFIETAKKLTASDIAVLSLTSAADAKTLADARALQQSLGANPPGAWALDLKDAPLSQTFRVQNMPTVVIISTDGKVLFNGDPSEAAFWNELNKLNPAIVRPDILLSPHKK